MQGSNQIKTFQCRTHSKETVQRVSKDLNSNQLLFCIDCVMEMDNEKAGKLISLKNFPDELAQQFSKTKLFQIKSTVPESFIQIIEKEDQFLKQMTQHIDQEKEKVVNEIKDLEDSLIEKLELTKSNILANLDAQLMNMRSILSEFKSRLQKQFNNNNDQNRNNEKGISPQEIIEQMNNCRSIDTLELKIRGWLNDLEKTLDPNEIEVKESEREIAEIEKFKIQQEKILKISNNMPISCFSDSPFLKIVNEQFNHHNEAFLRDLTNIRKEIIQSSFGTSFPSTIINLNKVKTIQEKINVKEMKLNLVYRGTEENFSSDSFMKLWLTQSKHFLLLIKSQEGYCGAYRTIFASQFGFNPNKSNQKFVTFDENSFQDVSQSSFIYAQSYITYNIGFPIQIAINLMFSEARGRLQEISYNKDALIQDGLMAKVPSVPIREIELYEVTYEAMEDNQIQNQDPFIGKGGTLLTKKLATPAVRKSPTNQIF